MDRLIKELKLSPKEIKTKLDHIIRDFNNLIDLYGEPEQKENWKVDPAMGTVAFGSALHKSPETDEQAQPRTITLGDSPSTWPKKKE